MKVAGVSVFTTPNRDFYRVDTSLVVPGVDVGSWRLRIHGRGVTRPRTYTLDELLARPLIERDITLSCVSNGVGGPCEERGKRARWCGPHPDRPGLKIQSIEWIWMNTLRISGYPEGGEQMACVDPGPATGPAAAG